MQTDTPPTLWQRWFNIQPNEQFRVGVMFLYSLLAIGGVIIIGRAVSRTLFLSSLPESSAPYKYIFPPFFVVVVVSLYTRLVPRYKSSTLIASSSLIMGVGVLLFRLLLATPAGESFVSLSAYYIYSEIIASLVGIQFWTFAADIFNPREARRLFGLIAAGGVVANVLTGLLLQLVATVLAPEDLLYLVAISLVGGVGCIWVLRDQIIGSDRQRQPTATDQSSLRQDFRALTQTPLLLIIGGMMLITSLVTNITDYQLDLSLLRFFSDDSAGMLQFLGLFSLIGGCLAFVVQIYLTGRILERYGLLIGLLILPAGIIFGSTVLLITGGMIWAAALPRGADVVFRYTINDVSLNLLFLPVPKETRRRAKAILDGVIKPPIVGLLGLGFLLFMRDDVAVVGVQAIDIVPWSIPVLFLTVAWLWLARQGHRHYVHELANSLRRRRLNLSDTALDFSDEITRQLLLEGLADSQSLRVLHVLQLLSRVPGKGWEDAVAPLLQHEDTDVRLAALRYLTQAPTAVHAEAVYALCLSEVREVQAAAILAYCELIGPNSVDVIAQFLRAEDLEVQAAAMTGLIKFGGLDGIMQAAGVLKALFASEVAQEREAGARVLGMLQVNNFYKPLIPLLQDSDPDVQLMAIRAAGQIRHVALVPPLLEALRGQQAAQPIIDALRQFEPTIAPQLIHEFEQIDSPIQRIRIIKILSHFETKEVADFLTTHVHAPHLRVRAHVLRALVRLSRYGMTIPLVPAQLDRLLRTEVRHIYELQVIQYDLAVWRAEPRSAEALLIKTLQDHVDYTIDRCFYLLQLIYPTQNLMRIRRAIMEPALQASGLELLDTILERPLKTILLPLFEGADSKRLSIAIEQFGLQHQPPHDWLAYLLEHPETWLQAGAIYVVSAQRIERFVGLVQAQVTASDPILRETAVMACRRLLPTDAFKALIAERLATEDSPLVRQQLTA